MNYERELEGMQKMYLSLLDRPSDLYEYLESVFHFCKYINFSSQEAKIMVGLIAKRIPGKVGSRVGTIQEIEAFRKAHDEVYDSSN